MNPLPVTMVRTRSIPQIGVGTSVLPETPGMDEPAPVAFDDWCAVSEI
jgi:hypothetical protein